MDDNEKFHIDAAIDIKNTSTEEWKQIVLYFIPNMFTKENSPSLENPALININAIYIDGQASTYSLEKDTLTLPLPSSLSPDKNVKVRISYEFTMPLEGLRFTKKGDDFHLAEWYPMVPTYRNGWNKHEYRSRGETYHTAFSDFYLKMEIPSSYTIVTSSGDDKLLNQKGKEIVVKNVKELFIGLIAAHTFVEETSSVQKVNVRVFGNKGQDATNKEVLTVATKAIEYFSKEFGPYPSNQFDVIVGGLGMEYPGIVTVGSIYNSRPVNLQALKRMVVHEVAHQWFYGIVSNDPYQDAWLDEGFAELATLLYYTEFQGDNYSFEFGNQLSKERSLPVNLPLDQYAPNEQSSYIYGKASTQLGAFFQKFGGEEAAKKFIKEYVKAFRYKEVNTKEFVSFTKQYFDLNDNKEFVNWLEINE